MNLQQLAESKGLDLNHEIRNYKRRLNYAQHHESRSQYYWPGTTTIDRYTKRYGNADQISRSLADLRASAAENDTINYVSIWCRLNHLKH